MGFWHTGYADFHAPTGLEDYVFSPPPPVRFVCEHCAETFEDFEELRRHRFEQHPVRQPGLWLRGRAVGAIRQIITMPIQAGDVRLQDVSRCLINGEAVSFKKIAQRLSEMRNECLQLRLENDDASTVFELDFQIADERHLKGVEKAFLDLAGEKQLTAEAVGRFSRSCEEFSTARLYWDGICLYLYGVMAKERSPDSGLHQTQYVEHFLRAEDELRGFDRRLARSVRALIAFHFNRFDEAELLAPEGALRHAASAFSGLLQGLPWHFDAAFLPSPGGVVENLLTDQDTLQILSDASHGVVELKARAAELVAHQQNATKGGYDQMKRSLLAAEALAACEDDASHTQARKLARELAGKPDTHVWAETILERLERT